MMKVGVTDKQFYSIIKKVNFTTPQDIIQSSSKSDMFVNKIIEKCIHSTKSDIFSTLVTGTRKINTALLYYLRNKDEIEVSDEAIRHAAESLKGSGILQEILPSVKRLSLKSMDSVLKNGGGKYIPECVPKIPVVDHVFNNIKKCNQRYYKPYAEVENHECFVCMLEKRRRVS